MIWIPVTLGAAVFQILRTSQQHALRSFLSPSAAGYVRFLFATPFAWVACLVTFLIAPEDISIPGRFWAIIGSGGVAQILGTVALLQSFRLRDFAIGTVYSKSEVILVAIVSAVLLSEPLAAAGWIGVVLVVAGVAMLASDGRLIELLRSAGDPAALMGLLAAVGFALSAAGIRGASTSLEGGTVWHRSMLTLVALLTIQTVVNGAWLAWRDPAQLVAIRDRWATCLPVGAMSMAGTTAWTVAMTLTSAAKVRTLGQIEIVLAFVIGVVAHQERHTRLEYTASALVVAGVIGVIVLG